LSKSLPCEGARENRILVAAMFSFEVDTLRVSIEQHRGIADMLIVESTEVHNIHENTTKPLLWKNTLYREYVNESFITSITCSPGEKKEMWDSEIRQNKCMSQAIHARKYMYDVVVVGSIDEILGRTALLRLKHCPLPRLPTSSAIGMPLGRLDRKFYTDWHYQKHPYSFSLPTLYPAQYDKHFVRSFRVKGSTPIIGGLHMTNYCFLPNIVLKELTATEYGHHMTRRIFCEKSIQYFKQECYSMLHTRTSPGLSKETEIPCALSGDVLPAWNGRVDGREIRFWKHMCM